VPASRGEDPERSIRDRPKQSISGRVQDANVEVIDQFLRAGTISSASRVQRCAGNNARAAEGTYTSRSAGCPTSRGRIDEQGKLPVSSGVAVFTVERHLVNFYGKIDARGRADTIVYALRHLLDTPPT